MLYKQKVSLIALLSLSINCLHAMIQPPAAPQEETSSHKFMKSFNRGLIIRPGPYGTSYEVPTQSPIRRILESNANGQMMHYTGELSDLGKVNVSIILDGIQPVHYFVLMNGINVVDPKQMVNIYRRCTQQYFEDPQAKGKEIPVEDSE